MDSKEALEKLLKENEDARERFKKIGNLSEEEAGNELQRFENEFGIELKKEDFAGQKLDSEQLEDVAGGADAMDWIGLGFSIYDLLNNPDATRRGSKGGRTRFNSNKGEGGRKHEPVKEILRRGGA